MLNFLREYVNEKFCIYICLFSSLVILSGCVNPALVKVPYDKPATVTSDKKASIQLMTGVVEGASGTTLIYGGPGVYIPISTGPIPELQFNLKDQQVFTVSLKDELNRLNILNVLEVSEQKVNTDNMVIQLVFAQTSHNPHMQEYFLNVGMQLQYSGKKFAKRYEVLSSEGETVWTKLNTNAAEGKMLAAKKLMIKILPDIQAFVEKIKNI